MDKISHNVFKTYFKDIAEINNKDLEVMSMFMDNLTNEFIIKEREQYDRMIYTFLKENGYIVTYPCKVEDLEALKQQLAEEDKFIDVIDSVYYTTPKDNHVEAIHIIIPFFNSISHPVSNDFRQYLIEEYLKKNNLEI